MLCAECENILVLMTHFKSLLAEVNCIQHQRLCFRFQYIEYVLSKLFGWFLGETNLATTFKSWVWTVECKLHSSVKDLLGFVCGQYLFWDFLLIFGDKFQILSQGSWLQVPSQHQSWSTSTHKVSLTTG